MIHEILEISGSHNITGSLLLPLLTEDTIKAPGSLAYQNGKTYVNDGTTWLQLAETAAPIVSTIEYLVVAGGGGGGSMGGGGGGGLLSSSLSSIESGSSITVTVGAGGSGQIEQGGATPNSGTDSSIASSTGTSFTTVTSTGGGKGGGSSAAAAQTAGDGGSGGGGAGLDTSGPGGSGTGGQGFDGGDGIAHGTRGSGGGGGGAGEAGANAVNNTTGGDGGDGKQSSITGTTTYYAGGGGGGSYLYTGTGNSSNPGQGGATGGQSNSGYSSNGTANTGGGAGSGGFKSTGWQAGSGAGGSGVVVLAYPSSSINAAGGIIGDAGNGRKYHQFNESDILKVGSTTDFQIVTDNLLLHFDAGNFNSRGTSTVTDISTNSNNGTVNGATLGQNWWYDFDGSNDYITAPLSNYVSSGYSVEFWVYKDAIDSTYDCIYASGYALQFYWRSNFIEMYIATTDGASYVVNSVQITGLSATTWVHAVITDDGSGNVVMYKDGAQSNTTTYSGNPFVYSGTPRIGDYPQSAGSYPFDGRISQFRIYSDVLTATEVLQNYNATKTNFT